MRSIWLVLALAAGCSSSNKGGGGGSGGTGGGGSSGNGGACSAPIMAADTSTPTTVVGNGSSGSCTEAALVAAVAQAGTITFNCGGPTTITLTAELALSTTADTILDGGGNVTLDGGGATRILYYSSANYRATKTTVTLQHLTLQNGKSTGAMIPAAPAPCSQGYVVEAGGGGIFVRDGILHVLDVTFANNAAASPGPDVGGGAIYANGSLGVVIVGSTFTGNSGSNSGAVGSLNSDLSLFGNTFDGNMATGTGANSVDTSKCSAMGGEIGDGGNGGAVAIDGGSDGMVTTCGNIFHANVAGALGGALFRTPDGAMQETSFDQSLFDSNTSDGGGALYMHNSNIVITASTFTGNSAPGAGAIQADGSMLNFTNVTFAGNHATKGLGGAMSIFGNGGTLTNVTFAGNDSNGGSGFFAAAIAGGTAFTIDNTLFMNDTTMDAGSPMQCQGASMGSGNLQWPMTHVVGTAADSACVTGITFADAMVATLADNGGPVPTVSIPSSSPAVGLGTKCPSTDARGHARSSSKCAAGAFEP